VIYFILRNKRKTKQNRNKDTALLGKKMVRASIRNQVELRRTLRPC
jgi:hypothetical protein